MDLNLETLLLALLASQLWGRMRSGSPPTEGLGVVQTLRSQQRLQYCLWVP